MAESVPINAKEALECLRSHMSNAEVMERFKITPKGYADLLKQLFRRKLITGDDLARRGISFTIAPKEPDEPEPIPIAPPPAPDDEEFLDTAALTALLSLKSPAVPPARSSNGPAEIESPDDEGESANKKPNYHVTGLFKKSGEKIGP